MNGQRLSTIPCPPSPPLPTPILKLGCPSTYRHSPVKRLAAAVCLALVFGGDLARFDSEKHRHERGRTVLVAPVHTRVVVLAHLAALVHVTCSRTRAGKDKEAGEAARLRLQRAIHSGLQAMCLCSSGLVSMNSPQQTTGTCANFSLRT
eukprot:352861-Chlamydomonas_euryale.AAC.9